ncbi:dihydrolipoamide dehydrogenase [Natrinema hispanicum]|uniref:Dihydrolipoyl dehydrogenase n=1 Tax=Natrinema hispanicum TaxID=392421 RepID=A0A1I0IA55_9EURY|nr:dihydrolipoamide dehydrogenase [Natrinema hispanicum]SET92794.1 dihydrolipoamide dehydrogenase [Natrinema hispanicum]
MTYEFELPELGNGADEGTFVACHVEPGDVVTEGDLVAEVETDKSVIEVSAPVDGTVTEVVADPGDTVSVGEVVLRFDTDGKDAGDTSADADADDHTPAVTRLETPDEETDANESDSEDVTPAVTRIDEGTESTGPAEASTDTIDGVPASTEVLVIGAGPGGYVAAIRAAQLGLEVTLVEKDAYGGTCLNDGCIPSKALIHGADVAHEATSAEHLGISAEISVDVDRLTDWKDGVVDQLTGGVESLCRAAGVTLVDGHAAFVDDHRARISTDDGEATLSFEYAIVATGSRPIEIPKFEPDGERILDSSDALELADAPDRLLVVGAGYIGMELSTVFAKLGTDVTVVEMFDDVLPMYDDDISRVVRERAVEHGVEFRFGERAANWEPTDDGVLVTTEAEDGTTAELTADAVLVVAGREPAADTVNLEAIGIELDENGCVPTDAQGRTSRDHVFAVGDVAGEPMLAHKASYEGEVAAAAIAGQPAALDHEAMPAAVFTDPEVATVGLTREDAAEMGYNPVVGQMPLQANGRALTVEETDGFVRVVADKATERVLGAQIVAPNASELIGEVALALEADADLSTLAGTVHTHPTLSEAIMEAAADARDESVHTH